MTTLAQTMDLTGRHAVVTGATGGVGRVIAATLAELGADLTLVDRPGVDYAPLLRDIAASRGDSVRTLFCDLESEEARRTLAHSVAEHSGRLDILINNAAFVGTSELTGWVTDFENQSVETWRRVMEVNLTAVFHLSQALAPLLRNGHGSSIVNISSIYGSYGPDHRLYDGTTMGNPAAYAASKGGLIQLTRWLATTLAPHIRVNAISLGGILRGQAPAFIERYESRTPLRRMGTEADIRGAVTYLSSDLSSYVTGHVLAVDGGWGIW